MLCFRKYITGLLLLLFLIPIAYQSVHIFLLHSHSDTAYISLYHNEILISEQEDCLICSYECTLFYTKKDIEKRELTYSEPEQSVLIKDNIYLTFSGQLISMRAPPFEC